VQDLIDRPLGKGFAERLVAVHKPVVDRREDQIERGLYVQVAAELAIAHSLLDDRGGDGAAGPEPLLAQSAPKVRVGLSGRVTRVSMPLR